jgi:hypothetical protein
MWKVIKEIHLRPTLLLPLNTFSRKLTIGRHLFANKSDTEFHENLTDGFVNDARSHTDGVQMKDHSFHTSRFCTSKNA